jgi:hypothetical protein
VHSAVRCARVRACVRACGRAGRTWSKRLGLLGAEKTLEVLVCSEPDRTADDTASDCRADALPQSKTFLQSRWELVTGSSGCHTSVHRGLKTHLRLPRRKQWEDNMSVDIQVTRWQKKNDTTDNTQSGNARGTAPTLCRSSKNPCCCGCAHYSQQAERREGQAWRWGEREGGVKRKITSKTRGGGQRKHRARKRRSCHDKTRTPRHEIATSRPSMSANSRVCNAHVRGCAWRREGARRVRVEARVITPCTCPEDARRAPPTLQQRCPPAREGVIRQTWFLLLLFRVKSPIGDAVALRTYSACRAWRERERERERATGGDVC